MNKPDLFSDIRSIPGISDHEIILADCDLKPVICKKPPRTIYLWNKVDWNKIRLLASEFSESFLPEHGTRSVEKNYNMFKEFIALTIKVHIPNKLTSTRTNLPWFTGMILSNQKKTGTLCNTKSGRPAHVEPLRVSRGVWGHPPTKIFIFNIVFSTSKHFCCCLRPFFNSPNLLPFVHNNT